MIYKRIPIFDNKGEDILSHMETAYNFIEHAKHHGNILVHCHKGISRSASFVIGYLMRKNEMTFEEALTHVRSVRPMIQPNDSFLEQLRRYESILNEQRESEQLKQNSYNEKISRGLNRDEGDERDHKRSRMEVSVGPMPPPSDDIQLVLETHSLQVDIGPLSHPPDPSPSSSLPIERSTESCAEDGSTNISIAATSCDTKAVTAEESLVTGEI